MGDMGLYKGDLSGTENFSDHGLVKPGLSSGELLALSEQIDGEDTIVSFFPEFQNHGYVNSPGSAVNFADVICIDDNDNIQKVTVANSDSDADCTKLTNRYKVFRETSTGFDGVDYSTGNIPFPAAVTDTIYFLSDYVIPVAHFEFSTFGVYDTLIYERWNGTAWTATGITDGTLEATQDGDVNLGSVDIDNHPKTTINGKTGHAFRVRCEDTITTPAESDVFYWQWDYELSKCALLGEALFYDKTGGGVYTPVTPYIQYPNWGRVVFSSDPLAAGSSLKAAYDYKTPQPGTYVLTYSSIDTNAGTAMCQVNGGSDIGIRCDNKTPHTSIIPGVTIIFNNVEAFSVTDVTTFEVSESIKYLFYAKDTGTEADTYQNSDLTLNDTPVDGYRKFYHGYFPPISADCAKNTQYTKINAYVA